MKMNQFSIFLIFILLLSCNSVPVTEDYFSLEEVTITELQEKYQNKELTSEEVVQAYLNRIEELDSGEDGLNAIIELNPDAIKIAREMDAEREQGKVRSALHGVPFVVKDNINTGDKMQTTAGSLALEGHYAKNDAPIVAQLRDAGAVLIGKSNLSEWANFRSTNSVSGWSSRGGQTINPYGKNRNPCGSSSGSGVAVAANLVPFAIGTETNGSIVCPSAVNGIVGLKPTVGLLSRTGIIPISFTQDTAGPMTRTVQDAAIVLNAMIKVDSTDSKTIVPHRVVQDDYNLHLADSSLKDKRIGVLKGTDFSKKTTVIFEQEQSVLKEAGAELIEVEIFPEMNSLYGDAFSLLQYEFKDGLNKYLENADDVNIQSLKELIEFNKENDSLVMPFFDQEILELSQEKEHLDSEEYLSIYETIHTGAKTAIKEVLKEHQLDAIIAPTTSPAWCIDHVNGDHYIGGSSSLAAWSGFPIISVPMGKVQGLPVGMSFFTDEWQEDTLLQIACAYEQITKHRNTFNDD